MAYGYQTPNYQQGYMNPNPVPQQQQGNNIIWVQGENGAKSFLMAPNSTVQLWDSGEPLIYLKTTDASGMPSMKILKYEVIREVGIQSQTSSNSEYVTKEDLEKYFDAFGDKLIKQINGNNNYKHKYNKYENKGDVENG